MAKDAAELRELQHARRKKDLEAQKDVLVRAAHANGFEFSTADVEGYLRGAMSPRVVSEAKTQAKDAAQITPAAVNPENSRQEAA